MKRFRFSLDTLLRHRKIVEDRERTTLFQLRANLQREQRHRQELEQARQETREEMTPAGRTEIDPGHLQLGVRYLDRLGSEIGRSEKRIESLKGDVRAQTDAVVEATKNTKVIDTLKNRKLKQHLSDVEKDEQKMVDEIVVTRFGHKGL